MIKPSSKLYVNEFVLTKLDPECGLAQPKLVTVLLLKYENSLLSELEVECLNWRLTRENVHFLSFL